MAQLIRIDYHRKTGEIRVDCHRQLDGRGTYVLREKNAIMQLFKRKLLNRILRTQVSGDDYTRLEQEVLACLESQI